MYLLNKVIIKILGFFFFQVKFKSSFKFNIVRQKDPQMEFRYDWIFFIATDINLSFVTCKVQIYLISLIAGFCLSQVFRFWNKVKLLLSHENFHSIWWLSSLRSGPQTYLYLELLRIQSNFWLHFKHSKNYMMKWFRCTWPADLVSVRLHSNESHIVTMVKYGYIYG